MQGKITKRSVDALKPADRDDYLWDDGLPGFGVKITPEGRRVFLIQYRMGGRGFPTRRYTIGTYGAYTPEQAREKAKSLLQGVRDGIDPMGEKAAAKVNTVRKLVEQFVKSRQEKGRRSAGEIERVLTREVIGAWGDRPVVSITRQDIVRLLDTIKDRGAGTLANRTLAHIKTMFTWAENRGSLKSSPATGLEKPFAEISRDRTPSDSELIEIWGAAEGLGWPFGRAVQLLMLTGQRREEIGQMRWAEINFDSGLWSLPAERSKNGQPHEIHLSADAVALMRKLPRIDESELVFTTNGETPIQGWSKAKLRLDEKILEAREGVAKKAGHNVASVKPITAWKLHDLRRAFATGLNNLGILPHVADRILNHVAKSKGGVMAIYNRAAYLAERKAAMTLWSEHLARLLTGNTANVIGLAEHRQKAAI